jgi:glucuronate isomerase
MNTFLDDNFLLSNTTAQNLYHEYASGMPIIDYHCHLQPDLIASDIQFKNITQAWLHGDHYKWRAMRTNGISEEFITGNASDRVKFQKWAETVPYLLRNPLYHWSHLELKRYFDINVAINEKNADEIYEQSSSQLQTTAYSVRNLLRKMNVKVVCTTDDPADTLAYHRIIKEEGFEIKVFPTFRPDKAMNADDPQAFSTYVNTLEKVSGIPINGYSSYLDALRNRHNYFATLGCTLSDHGLEELYAEDYTDTEVKKLFDRIRSGKELEMAERRKLKSALLYEFALMDWEKGWVQQFHLGAFRNNNTRKKVSPGPDTGWDSIGDFQQGPGLAKFLDRLDRTNQLTRTILYNLNPRDNQVFATMAGNFNDGTIPGKIQYGAAWWFLDQKEGITDQLNALSNMSLISRFIGMLTDSRSFLSYPRHEYFRRILCNIIGEEIEKGMLPGDLKWTGKIIQDICYYNACRYFNWEQIIHNAPSETIV